MKKSATCHAPRAFLKRTLVSNKRHLSLVVLLCKMAKVMQQRCFPSDVVQQTYLTQDFRANDLHATQPADRGACCNGSPLASSDILAGAQNDTALPTFDLSPMLGSDGDRSPEHIQQLCQAVANCLRETGCLVVRDPRVKAEDNTAFLDMMEKYFAQSTAEKLKDSRPELHFQVSDTDMQCLVQIRQTLERSAA